MENTSLPLSVQGGLDWVLWRLKRYIARYGHRMVQASGTLNNLYVSLDEVRGLTGAATLASADAARQGIAGLPSVQVVDAAMATMSNDWLTADGPLFDLRRRFELTDDDVKLLIVSLAPTLSVDLSRLYGFAWADFSVKQPTVGFLLELIADDLAGASRLSARVHGDAPLVKGRLIELFDTQAWGSPSPRLHQGVRLPESVVDFICARPPALPRGLGVFCRHERAEDAPDPSTPLALSPGLSARLGQLVARGLSDQGLPLRMLLNGPRGTGRRTSLAQWMGRYGWGLMVVDLGALAPPEGQTPAVDKLAGHLADIGREALLHRCGLLLRTEDMPGESTAATGVLTAVGQGLGGFTGPLAVSATRAPRGLHNQIRHLIELDYHIPETSTQRALWTDAVQRADCRADDTLPDQLARRFTAPPGTIYTAVRDAVAQAKQQTRETPRITIDQIALVIRQQVDHALAAVAEPFATTLTWDDVVLPEEVESALMEVKAQARFREKVFDDWGFRRKMSYGRGLSCLFTGPPGTGKTMMAAILAQSLGREIYRVDLSRVVSKWIGETEKNLARVFDEAEKAQVMLLFDEADSLFSSRTEVKGSNDRFANMEINYLLQRMESYDGMSVLTTNFEKSIDEAFKRRIRFRIHFTLPDADERARLWKSMMPEGMQLSDGIKFEALGKKFKIAGGNIKNAVLRAAFFAAEGDGVMTHERLDKAAVLEMREMGRLI
ncbi:MAG: ATP-binding protein [Bradymonadia bacterium]